MINFIFGTNSKNNYKNFKVFRDNITEPRSYFIPYGSFEKLINTEISRERYESDEQSV